MFLGLTRTTVQSDRKTLSQIFKWKKLGFFTANLYEIWHVSTYNIYNYIHEIKKNAAASVRPPAAARRGRSKRHLRAL